MSRLKYTLDSKKDKSVSVESISFKVPDDLCTFLNSEGGAMGILGEENYVNLYSCAEIINLNKDYAVTEFLPGYLLIGTINDEALVLDQFSNYYIVPFVGMFEENCVKIAQSFEGLLADLTGKMDDK